MTIEMTAYQELDSFLNDVASECAKEHGGSYREVCIGLESALKELAENRSTAVSHLRINYYREGLRCEVLGVFEPPKDYILDGLWTVLYGSVMPRFTPFGPEPMRVSSLEIGYGLDPKVTYDSSHENGLPMAMNRPYDAMKAAGKSAPAAKSKGKSKSKGKGKGTR